MVPSRVGWNWGRGFPGEGREGTSGRGADGPRPDGGLGRAGRVRPFDKTQQVRTEDVDIPLYVNFISRGKKLVSQY